MSDEFEFTQGPKERAADSFASAFRALKKLYHLLENFNAADLPAACDLFERQNDDESPAGMFASEVLRRAFEGQLVPHDFPKKHSNDVLEEIDRTCLALLRFEQAIRSVLKQP